jgi:hypothetical protein
MGSQVTVVALKSSSRTGEWLPWCMPSDIRLEFLPNERLSPKWVIRRIERRIKETLDIVLKMRKLKDGLGVATLGDLRRFLYGNIRRRRRRKCFRWAKAHKLYTEQFKAFSPLVLK